MIFNSNIPGLFKGSRNQNKANRPVHKPDREPVDWLLEALALAGLMIFIGYVVYNYPKLPATIPSHFNSAGNVDDYSPKGSFWALPAIGFFIYCMMSIIALVPNQYNYTVQITVKNAKKQYTMAIRLIRYMKAAIIWLFFYISYTTVRVALNGDSGLGAASLPIILGGIFIPIIIYVVIAHKHR
jgi:uncharacterized membrane protein